MDFDSTDENHVSPPSCALNLTSARGRRRVTMAFLSGQEVAAEPAGVSLRSLVVRLVPHSDVNVRVITLQGRSFQEKHTSAKLYL